MEPMRKISLKLDSLTIESFATATAASSVGTVQGHDDEAVAATRICSLACTMYSCPVQNTEYASCQAVCDCTSAGSPC